MLDVLIKNCVVEIGNGNAWEQAEVVAAAEFFEEAQIIVPYAAMC